MESPDRRSSSEVPFLADDEKDMEFTYRKKSLPWWRHWAVSLVLLVAYSVVLVVTTNHWGSQDLNPYQVYTPARGAIKFRKAEFDGRLGLKTPYTGEPRPETEAAWHRIFKNYNLRFTHDEMSKMNRSALSLRNGGGHYGQLSVYHHLHCLKLLRLILWHDHYNISIPEMRPHGDHCVDDIRNALQCLPDLSVTTFYWQEHRRQPYPDFHLDQTCADWDAIDKWAEKRSFSLFDQKTVVHPKFGISFPKIDGEVVRLEPKGPEGDDPTPIWPKDEE